MAKASKQDVPTPVAARNFAARGIAGLLAPIARPAFLRRAPATATLLTDWPALAGADLAARAAPVKLAAGTLTLACTGPMALELQHRAPQIIARLNLALGGRPVERLRFIARPPEAPPPHRAATPPATPPATPSATPFGGLPEGELGAALARLYLGIAARQK